MVIRSEVDRHLETWSVDHEDELMELLDPRRTNMWASWSGSVGLPTAWLFRGQKEASWSLMPTAFRDRGFYAHHLKDPLALAAEEARHVLVFHCMADAHGLHDYFVPELAGSLKIQVLKAEKPKAFGLGHPDGSLRDFSTSIKSKVHAAYGIAQHYGVPTRLLDWTDKPEIALFFAVHGSIKEFGTPGEWPDQCAIWAIPKNLCFLRKELVEVDPEMSWRFCTSGPSSFNRNKRSQFGWFSLDQYAETRFGQDGKTWISHDEAIRSECQALVMKEGKFEFATDDIRLRKIVFPGNRSGPIMQMLFKMGHNPVSIQPAMHSIIETIRTGRTLTMFDELYSDFQSRIF